MNSKTFKCTFLSDVVLNADTATEGNQQSLDYIPGACFLGIVAKDYAKVSNAYDIFHSGKVRFGDAHIAKDNKRSLKQPASWFYEKGDEDKCKIYLHHLVTDTMRQELANKSIQLKQIRSGYFINNNIISAEHDFAIKSAYNREERRSAAGQLYGYDALRKGNEWIFTIDADDNRLLAEVTQKLIGEHNIGRSKTAQYGRVKITELSNFSKSYEEIKNQETLAIYFESCAAFIDDNGSPTYQPSNADLGLTEASTIDWAKSQILTKTFAPWNGQRKTRDADKVCIDKGSVIIVKNGTIDQAKIARGVGIYRNEGFGKIIINPDFLQGDSEISLLEKHPEKQQTANSLRKLTAIVDRGENDDKTLAWIDNQRIVKAGYAKVVKATNEFISEKYNKFTNISASQWGSIRARSQRITDFDSLMDELFQADKGYLRHGKTLDKWRNKYTILEDTLEDVKKTTSPEIARRFLINLCSEMAKKCNQEK